MPGPGARVEPRRLAAARYGAAGAALVPPIPARRPVIVAMTAREGAMAVRSPVAVTSRGRVGAAQPFAAPRPVRAARLVVSAPKTGPSREAPRATAAFPAPGGAPPPTLGVDRAAGAPRRGPPPGRREGAPLHPPEEVVVVPPSRVRPTGAPGIMARPEPATSAARPSVTGAGNRLMPERTTTGVTAAAVPGLEAGRRPRLQEHGAPRPPKADIPRAAPPVAIPLRELTRRTVPEIGVAPPDTDVARSLKPVRARTATGGGVGMDGRVGQMEHEPRGIAEILRPRPEKGASAAEPSETVHTE